MSPKAVTDLKDSLYYPLCLVWLRYLKCRNWEVGLVPNLFIMELRMLWDHPFSTFPKFSEKLTFLTPWYAHVRVYQGLRNASFSESFGNVLNKWSLCKLFLCVYQFLSIKHRKYEELYEAISRFNKEQFMLGCSFVRGILS